LQVAGHDDEIFLQHLQGNNAGAHTAMFIEKLDGATLLGSVLLVVGVDEDVGIEEAAHSSAGESRCD
jgi:hypothetical protein